jgi:peptidyl-prolyl cis-trans isomerase D
MLSTLRHKGVAKKILWVVTVIIVLSFAVFGTAWKLDNSLNSAGKINGHTVSLSTYQKAYYDARDAAIMMYGDKFFKYGSRLNLDAQTWDRLILIDEAKKRGVTTTDQEVVETIASIPFFQTEGRFDQAKYAMIITNPQGFGRKVLEFEKGIRNQIIIKKLVEQVVGGISLNDEELKKEYVLKNEKIKLNYTLFEPLKAAKDLQVSDDDVKKYFETDKEQFRKPPMVNVEYAVVNYPENATDAQKAAVKIAVESLSKSLKSDSDFKAVALALKIDVKESGLFSQNQPLLTFAWSPELVEKIFTMKQGQYSPAFETPDGWEIIRIKEYKDTFIPSFDEVKAEAKNALLTDKGFTAAKANADAGLKVIAEGLKAGKSFKDAAQGLDVKYEETPLFGRGEYIANMGIVAEFQEVAAKLNMTNRLSDVIATNEGPAIIYLDAVEGIDEKQYESDQANFKDMIIAQKKSQKAAEFVTELRIKAKLQNDIEKRTKK